MNSLVPNISISTICIFENDSVPFRGKSVPFEKKSVPFQRKSVPFQNSTFHFCTSVLLYSVPPLYFENALMKLKFIHPPYFDSASFQLPSISLPLWQINVGKITISTITQIIILRTVKLYSHHFLHSQNKFFELAFIFRELIWSIFSICCWSAYRN